MNWTAPAVVVSVHRFSEHALRVTALTEDHGLYTGIVRYGHKQRGVFDVGNHLLLRWSARLPEHMGTFSGEMITPFAAHVMDDAARLEALAHSARLTHHFLPERTPESPVYEALLDLLHALGNNTSWQKTQALFELTVLAATGYGLDLETCAATQTRNNLVYVSPKSGRAVSQTAGAPYHEKLLPLPGFFLDPSVHANAGDVHNARRITAFFLDRAAAELHKPPLHLASARNDLQFV